MSTMIEEWDAQMMDYSMDPDIHMHTSAPSPKNDWPHPEATMEDATTSSYPIQEDVEIDMDQYYESPQEYEMADEQHVGTTHDEPVDVDVYDASREAATHITEPTASASLSQDQTGVFAGNPTLSEAIVETHGHLDLPVLSSSEGLIPAMQADASAPPLSSETRHPSENPTFHEAIAHSDSQAESSEYTHPNFAPAAAEHAENLAGQDYTTDAPHSSEPSAEGAGTSAHESISHVENSEGSSAASSAPQDLPSEPAREHLSSTDHEALSSAVPSEEQHGEEHSQDPDDHTADYAQTEEPTTDQPQQYEEHVEPDHDHDDNVEQAAADPHEISEGVYIDPPPPVLLEIPSSSEHTECCLFNAPGSQSGLHSPVESRSTAGTDPSSSTVLLSSRPTLYYERLSDVFLALRDEERVRSIPELFDGELVFDAYDLQLVISEDNSYAREVNLHDLNELHDNLGLPGPLRLRLTSLVPRFIARYRSLKDQIARLTLREADQETEVQHEEQEHHEQEVYQAEDDEGNYEDAEEGEPTQTEEEYYDTQPHEEYAGQPHPDYEQHEEQDAEQQLGEDTDDRPNHDHQHIHAQDQEQILREQALAPFQTQYLNADSDHPDASELINDQEHHPGYPTESDAASSLGLGLGHDQQSQHGQDDSQIEAVDVAHHSAQNPNYHEVGVDGDEATALEDENEYEDSGIALRDDDVQGDAGVDVVRGDVEEVDDSFGADEGAQQDAEGEEEGSVDIEEFDEDIHRHLDTDAGAGVGQDNTEYEEYTEPREDEEQVGEEYPGEAFGGEVQDNGAFEAGSEGDYLELEGGEELQEEAVFEGEGYIDEEGVEVPIDDVQQGVADDAVQNGEVDNFDEFDADAFDGAGTDITDSEAARLLDYVQAQAEAHSHSPQGSHAEPGSIIENKDTDYAAYSPTEDSHENTAEQTQQNQDEENYGLADETFDTTRAENGDDLHEYENESFDDGGPNVDELDDEDGHALEVAAHVNGSEKAHADLHAEEDEPEFDEEDDDDLYAGDLTVQGLDDVGPDAHSTDSLLSIVSKTSSKRGFEEVDDDDYELELEEGEHVVVKAGGDLSPGSKRARVQ